MITGNYGDQQTRPCFYIDFRDRSQGTSDDRKAASTRVVSEYPLVLIDCDELGKPIGVCVHEPRDEPDPLTSISDITRTT